MGKGRAPCCDKNQVKRGPWSPAEDLRLITFIQKHGHDNWRALPKQAGLLRCGKSCRLRWINYLRPDVKRGNFTQDEEDTIVKLHKAWGNKWSKIASRLPGRTDNEIKNVWNTHLKKRLNAGNISDNSGDESKDSPTTSSSSSSTLLSSNQNQNSLPHQQSECPLDKDTMSESPHGEFTEESQQFDPRPDPIEPDPKEQSTCSVLSFESTNKSTMEIPFECDLDFWNMLETVDWFQTSEAVGIRQPESCRSSNVPAESGAGELENERWLRYLENELGLEQMPEVHGGSGAGERFLTENSEEGLGDFDWSKDNQEVDPWMSYFQMGPL